MVEEESKQSSQDPNRAPENTISVENGQIEESLFSPRFKSVAAMAGWDEEALLIASLIVEDTPVRESGKHKKRSDLQFKSPPSASARRKHKNQRRSIVSIPIADLNLDEDVKAKEDSKKRDVELKSIANEKKPKEGDPKEVSEQGSSVSSRSNVELKPNGNEKEEKGGNQKEVAEQGPSVSSCANKEPKPNEKEQKQRGGDPKEVAEHGSSVSSSSNSVLPCMDKLREELSCAICLEICFEPSTTPCGHSFCKRCLRSAADRCGKKCPKCRQLISNGRSCTVNTVLWNTIQLLFPEEVEARKKGGSASNSGKTEQRSPQTETRNENVRSRSNRPTGIPTRVAREAYIRSRRRIVSQDDDAALALRLQREEFMEAFREPQSQSGVSSVGIARANLRALASRLRNREHRALYP